MGVGIEFYLASHELVAVLRVLEDRKRDESRDQSDFTTRSL